MASQNHTNGGNSATASAENMDAQKEGVAGKQSATPVPQSHKHTVSFVTNQTQAVTPILKKVKLA